MQFYLCLTVRTLQLNCSFFSQNVARLLAQNLLNYHQNLFRGVFLGVAPPLMLSSGHPIEYDNN